MPIYEYVCQDCLFEFEEFVLGPHAEKVITCPRCKGTHTKKGWSRFGFGKLDAAKRGLDSSSSSCSPAGT